MKTKLILLIVLTVLFVTGFLFRKSEEPVSAGSEPTPQQTQTNNSWLERFYIGAVDEDYDYPDNYPHLNRLGFNLWHSYVGEDTSNPNRAYPQMLWSRRYNGDKLMDSVGSYCSTVNGYINQIYGAGERKLIAMRPKIEWLCYGQRSDYKCNDTMISDNEKELWFYHFQKEGHNTGQNIIDYSSFGNGAKVRFCSTIPSNPDPPGLVVSRLKANTEQCHSVDPQGGNEWRCDSQCDWLIKPKIRIPADFVIPSNYETPVCKIKVIHQNGDTVLKEVIIKAKYFLNSQGQYDGSYIEEYNFGYEPYNLKILHRSWGDDWCYKARGNHNPDRDNDNHSDIQVYWYGNCDMWIDYVRVDNDVADGLMNPNSSYYITYNNWITQEANLIGPGKIMKYYLELVEFNNLPCMAYVDSILHTIPGAPDLMQDLTNTISTHVSWDSVTSIENPTFLNHQYIQKVGFTQIFAESYPMTACYTTVAGQQCFSQIPNTLPVTSGDNVLAQAVSPSSYDTWLQDNINHKPYLLEPGGGNAVYCGQTSCGGTSGSDQLHQDKGNFRYKMQLCDSVSKLANIPFIFMPQAHQWFRPGEVRREPTIEELNMMANVGVSYGVRGMIYFMYYSWKDNDCLYGTGITVPNGTALRTVNYYGQTNKDLTFQAIVNRLSNKWSPYLLSFNNTDRHSYIYDEPTERSNFLANTYFTEIRTCLQDPTTNCADLKQNTNYENPNSTYIQAAIFKKDGEQYTNYFMLVNRRCSPGDDDCSGRRFVTVLFDSISTPEFVGFNNWKIIDLYNDSLICTFDKRLSIPISFGKYKPGEGKLYKIVPVMIDGGTLVTYEEVENISFECKGTVNNAGYDITINPRTDIQFHFGTEINMTGGKFICGNNTETSNNVNLTGKNNALWFGINFNHCDTIQISKTNIINAQNIEPQDSSKYAINLINCTNVVIQNSIIHSYGVGAINSLTTDTTISANSVNYIAGNNFVLDDFLGYTVRFIQVGFLTLPVRIEDNTFTHTGNYIGNCAIFLSGVSAGSIISNYITDYYMDINLLSSSIDLFGNTLISNLADSKLINAVSGSTLIMGESDTKYTNGYNLLNSTADTSHNIYLDNSSFYTYKGSNSFKIKEDDPSSYHFGGNIPNVDQQTSIDASYNCFYLGENIDTNILLYWSGTDNLVPVIIDPMSQECLSNKPTQMEVFVSDGGINDTLYVRSGGYGGGEKAEKVEVNTSLKSLYGNLCYQTRKRNYDSIIFNASQIINLYPDSLNSLDAVSKLYFASLKKDSAGSRINPLKTYFEALILNNPNNTALISKSFYFIQKCKVSLKQYTSALAGFQQIIQQNPYSYEALLASWDYASTSLLMNGGSGGGSSNEKLIMNNEEYIEGGEDNSAMTIQLFTEYYDSTKFSKTDRVKLFDITKKTFEIKKKDEIKQIEILQTRSSKGDREAQKELYKMKTINEVAKANKPKSYDEYIRIINNNIDKIFTDPKLKGNKQNVNNFIPKEFSLYQNYPNPFNPVTKISFDLPKDAKIKLIVYDILGREITRLLNSEFRPAGKYIVEFNAINLNLASGVYFYRVESGDFNTVKKMVLIK